MMNIWNFDNFANHTAILTDDDKVYSYQDIQKMQHLLSFFTKERCILFILCTNTINCLIGYISCIINGAVPLLLDAKISETALSNLIKIYSPKYIWCPSNVSVPLKNYKNVVYIRGNYHLREATYYQTIPLFSELALLLQTSGSTGNSKVIRLSYENLLSNTESICNHLHIKPENRTITTLPMNYTYGLSILNTYLFSGASILLTEKKIFQINFWNVFEKHKVTSFSGVPYIYELLRKLNPENLKLDSLHTMTQAGGKMNSSDLMFFQEFSKKKGIQFFIMYGQTEATARISYLPPKKCIEKSESVGISIPCGEISIQNDYGHNLAPFQEGEVIYKGKNVMLGYAKSTKDLLLPDMCNGTLNTGDIGYLDEDGFLYLVGRKKRFVKLYGYRINLNDVEQILYEKFHVKFYCINDEESLCIISEQKPSHDWIFYLKNKLKIGQNVIKIKQVIPIPRTSAGKVDYSKLLSIISSKKEKIYNEVPYEKRASN